MNVAEVTLPGAYALQLIELCARWGVSGDELVEGLGMAVGDLVDPATLIPDSAFAIIIRRALAWTGESGLGFCMGLQMRLSWHGFLGFAAMTASTVREAI